MRFVAAMTIVVFHSTHSTQVGDLSPFKQLLKNMVVGVDLFFIISGFLIISLLMREKEKYGHVNMLKFYARRLLRILPLYYLVLALAAGIFYKELGDVHLSSFMLFFANFSLIAQKAWTLSVLNPLWTICVEMHFYLIIPVLVTLFPLRKLYIALLAIILMSLVFRMYLYVLVQAEAMEYYLHTLSRIDVLALGGLLAYYTHYKKVPKLNALLVSILAIGGLLLAMLFTSYMDYSTLLKTLFGKYLFVLPLIVLFYSFYLSRDSNTLIAYFKQHELFNYFGKISYGLYMYHSFVIYFLFQHRFIHTSSVYKLVIISSLSIAIAGISYSLFEKRFLSLKKWFR